MKKYIVTLEEVVTYSVEVEAKDEDDARAAGEEAFVQGFAELQAVDSRNVVDVQEIIELTAKTDVSGVSGEPPGDGAPLGQSETRKKGKRDAKTRPCAPGNVSP